MKRLLKVTMLAGVASLLILSGCAGNNYAAYEYESTIDVTRENDFRHLRTPYVGSAHATHAVVNILPLPGENWTISSIQIGTDHGDFSVDHSPYALTIFYEPRLSSVIEGYASRDYLEIPEDIFDSNSELLFELIENLQVVTFSVNFFSGEDVSFFDYRWSRSRSGEYSLRTGDKYESIPFAIFIDLMENVNLGFGNLFEVNYNDAFEEVRGFRFDGQGARLVIWANRPLFNLSLDALYPDFVDDELRFTITDTVFRIDKLNPASADAFVIDEYYGMGTMPWSGISFEDEFGERRYFWLQQSGYDGRFHLQEFEPLQTEHRSEAGTNGVLAWLVAPTLPHDSITMCLFGAVDSQRRLIDPQTGQLTGESCDGHGGHSPNFVYDREEGLFGHPGYGDGYHTLFGVLPMNEFIDIADQWTLQRSRGLIAVEAVDSTLKDPGSEGWDGWWLADEAFLEQFAVMYGHEFITGFIFDGGSRGWRNYEVDYIAMSKNGKWGAIDTSGSAVIDFIFDNLVIIDEHSAFAKYNGSYGILDIRNSRLP